MVNQGDVRIGTAVFFCDWVLHPNKQECVLDPVGHILQEIAIFTFGFVSFGFHENFALSQNVSFCEENRISFYDEFEYYTILYEYTVQ